MGGTLFFSTILTCVRWTRVLGKKERASDCRPPRRKATAISWGMRTGEAQGEADESDSSRSHSLTPTKRRVVGFLVMSALLLATLVVLALTVNPTELQQTLGHANPIYLLASASFALLTWLGAALPLVAFSPVAVPLKDAVLVQMASSFAGVLAPSGLAEVAATLRYLTVRHVSMPSAVSTLVLINIAQGGPSILLVIVVLFSAGFSQEVQIDLAQIGSIALWLMLGVALAAAIPPIRRFVWRFVLDVWHKFYPQLVWAIHRPKRLVIALLGSLLQTLSYVGALSFALMAFGQHVPFFTLAAAFLIANTVGSIAPIPGGVGSREAALAATLTVIGVPLVVAVPATVAYRLTTFYGLVPIGYVALLYMQRKQLV